MIYELHIKGVNSPIQYENIFLVDTGVWAYVSKTKRVFYPYSVIERIIEEELDECSRSMKEEHICNGEARMLPTENVKHIEKRIYKDVMTFLKNSMEATETTFGTMSIEEQCILQDLIDYLNEKSTPEA